jgi:hypothetical protein
MPLLLHTPADILLSRTCEPLGFGTAALCISKDFFCLRLPALFTVYDLAPSNYLLLYNVLYTTYKHLQHLESLKLIDLCTPSQNGLFFEAPHLHNATPRKIERDSPFEF